MSYLLKQLSKSLLTPENNIRRLIISSPNRYKEYQIEKRKKGEFRKIAQPAKEVKLLQYWFIENILREFPVHKSAMAYVSGRGIKRNAEAHVGGGDILKMDFKNFFPSIVPEDFVYLHDRQGNKIFDTYDIELANNILFWRPKGRNELQLSIGAPSSPLLSNVVMYEFDQMVLKGVKEIGGVIYTRYADDLTFSGPDFKSLYLVEKLINKTVKNLERPCLLINKEKTVYVSRRHRRYVTGIVLTNDGKLSIGRDKKRELRAAVHHFISNEIPTIDALKLHGYLAFVNDVEPEFLMRLKKKYGEDFLERLKEIHREMQYSRSLL